jgi:hypothetical protein
MIRRLFLLILLLPFCVEGQILDDSTRQVYGPSTTRFLYEQNFLQDDTLYLHPDTLIDGFRFMTKNRASGWMWQDLGNAGTAARRVIFDLPENAFTETGFTAFSELYGPRTDKIKYYNTRSPFTNMSYIQSSRGLGNLGFTHSRNINERLNVTLDLERISSSKQYSARTSEERLVDHWDFTLSSNYTTKNKKYTVLASFIHFNHKQIEQGGIRPLNNEPFVLPEDIASAYRTTYQQRLVGVESSERWNDIHLYQQYQFGKGIQFFHVLDYQRHKYFHSDTLLNTNFLTGAYPDSLEAEKMRNYYFLQNIQNRFGFKGFFRGFKYNVGLTSRIYSWNAIHEGQKGNLRTEILAGGNAGYWFADSATYINTDFYLGVGQNLNIFLNSRLQLKRLNLGFKFINKPPQLFYQRFDSEIFSWNNNFGGQRFTEATGNIRLGGKKTWLIPGASIRLFDNYLYFDQSQSPVQLNKQALISSLDLNAGIKLKDLKVSSHFYLNSSGNSEVFRMPVFMVNGNIEYHVRYAKVLDLYFGTDIYYRSSYKAYSYSPLLQSFYLQDEQYVWGIPVADLYTNFLIKRVKLAFSFNYLNKGFPTQGFFTTPNYLAMGRAFHLKINWPLFD